MKSKLIFLCLFLYTSVSFAKEGMWLPFLLDKMNEKEMKGMGMKITAKDIYDINNGSLKDAVVIFGSGCTGEVVSDKGLVLTNHHCGYGTVQGLSSVEHDYLTNGFWAMNQSEELPCPGLSVTFIVRIDDVTKNVKQGIEENFTDSAKAKIRALNIEKIQKAYKDSTGFDASVKSFFYDNTFYIFLTEKYTDIRLVGFPPDGIGEFGGSTDNWSWPRHTGDFGVFRIYADKDNKPAAYSKNNVAYKPKRFFKINIGGVKENDFTWVYGFPGRTTEYLSSSGVAEIMNILDPARIAIREKALAIMETDMHSSNEIFIKYAAKKLRLANYYKKWQGELLGLQINNAIEKKKAGEAEFTQWVQADKKRSSQYGHLLNDLSEAYTLQENSARLNEYLTEAIGASELVKSTAAYRNLIKLADSLPTLDSVLLQKKNLMSFLNNSDKETDKKITKALFQMYASAISGSEYTEENFIDKMYLSSFLTSSVKLDALLSIKDKQDFKSVIRKDPAYQTYLYFDSIQIANSTFLKKNQQRIASLYTSYIQALQEFNSGKQFYPDANSTLRVTYGKVEGVKPKDGVLYTYYTTLDGAMMKNNDAVDEFRIPAKLKALHNSKDYGRYAILEEGKPTVPLAFLASNHTTGGNSGSPVMNAKGELIGTNFDRIWEGTMSDILFDPNLCRNITLDIRYTLFIIEKFGGAKWVVDEMNIVK
ncbi:asp/Glu-specific dipeptidyl-peptidase [Filimonas sp.]|nr:asp/Glu-specific dipeptidyl-peptidase [Filimonas sp.]